MQDAESDDRETACRSMASLESTCQRMRRDRIRISGWRNCGSEACGARRARAGPHAVRSRCACKLSSAASFRSTVSPSRNSDAISPRPLTGTFESPSTGKLSPGRRFPPSCMASGDQEPSNEVCNYGHFSCASASTHLQRRST